MTQNEKDLLLKDLTARLSYGVHIHSYCSFDQDSVDPLYSLRECNGVIKINDLYYIEEVKPYLRPISSITDDEERELNGLLSEVYDFTFRMDELLEFIQMQKEIPFRYIDWFNSHHFDYRGLIPMGIALEAPEDMYNK